jgi:septation ring formation regulator EzrA
MTSQAAQHTVTADLEAIEKCQKLMALALEKDAEDNAEEQRTAAITCLKLIQEKNIALVPKTYLEAMKTTLNGATALAKEAKQEKWTNIGLGVLVGAVVLPKILKLR